MNFSHRRVVIVDKSENIQERFCDLLIKNSDLVEEKHTLQVLYEKEKAKNRELQNKVEKTKHELNNSQSLLRHLQTKYRKSMAQMHVFRSSKQTQTDDLSSVDLILMKMIRTDGSLANGLLDFLLAKCEPRSLPVSSSVNHGMSFDDSDDECTVQLPTDLLDEESH